MCVGLEGRGETSCTVAEVGTVVLDEVVTDTRNLWNAHLLHALVNDKEVSTCTVTHRNRLRSEDGGRSVRAPTVKQTSVAYDLTTMMCHVRREQLAVARLRTFIWRRAATPATSPVLVTSSFPIVLRPGPLPFIRVPVVAIRVRWRIRRVRPRRRISRTVRRARPRAATRRRVARTRPRRHVQRVKLRVRMKEANAGRQIRV